MNASDEVVWKIISIILSKFIRLFKSLTAAHPELTRSEEKLCAYIIIILQQRNSSCNGHF